MLGRIRHVDPTTRELFYFWMLLMVVWGAQSFEDLRKHAGLTHSTFCEACQARGLLGDDSKWSRVFNEAIVWASASQSRNLFVNVLMYCDVRDAGKLFEKYWKFLVDDILYIREKMQLGISFANLEITKYQSSWSVKPYWFVTREYPTG